MRQKSPASNLFAADFFELVPINEHCIRGRRLKVGRTLNLDHHSSVSTNDNGARTHRGCRRSGGLHSKEANQEKAGRFLIKRKRECQALRLFLPQKDRLGCRSRISPARSWTDAVVCTPTTRKEIETSAETIVHSSKHEEFC